MPMQPPRLLKGEELGQKLAAARSRLDQYSFLPSEKEDIIKYLDWWKNCEDYQNLNLNAPSAFRLTITMSKWIGARKDVSGVRAKIATLLLVCASDYPEMVTYLRKLTKNSALVAEWDTFATSHAWAPYRQDDSVGSHLPAGTHRATNEDDSAPQSLSREPRTPAQAKSANSAAHCTKFLVDRRYKSCSMDYIFPLLTKNGKLEGYTPATTLRPADGNVKSRWDFTLRVGYHAASGAAVLALVDMRYTDPTFNLYAAACTIDERPLENVPEQQLAPREVTFFRDFQKLNTEALCELVNLAAQSGYSLPELLKQAQLNASHKNPESDTYKPLEDLTSISRLDYGDVEALPEEIVDAAMDGRTTGLLSSFEPQVDMFHAQLQSDLAGQHQGNAEKVSAAGADGENKGQSSPTKDTTTRANHTGTKAVRQMLNDALAMTAQNRSTTTKVVATAEEVKIFNDTYFQTIPGEYHQPMSLARQPVLNKDLQTIPDHRPPPKRMPVPQDRTSKRHATKVSRDNDQQEEKDNKTEKEREEDRSEVRRSTRARKPAKKM